MKYGITLSFLVSEPLEADDEIEAHIAARKLARRIAAAFPELSQADTAQPRSITPLLPVNVDYWRSIAKGSEDWRPF